MIWRLGFSLLLLVTLAAATSAQTFRPRGKSTSVPNRLADESAGTQPHNSVELRGSGAQPSQLATAKTTSVSADLQKIYQWTESATSEEDFAQIAGSCVEIIGQQQRSQADHDYASSLLAWAMNRRGEVRSQRALELAEKGHIKQGQQLDALAADDFLVAVRHSPNNWRHRHNHAIALAMRGDYRAAIAQLNKAIELNPSYANAYFNRGELHFELQNFEAAELDYTAAIEQQQDAQFYNGRAHCRFLLENYQQALEDYQHASRQEADNATFLTDWADACQFLGYWDQANQAYRAAIAADKNYARAYQNVGWLMATCPDKRLRNHELALSAAQKALALSGKRSVEVLETLAAATAAMGRFEQAHELQAEAVQVAKAQSDTTAADMQEYQHRLELYRQGQTYLQAQNALTDQPQQIARAPKDKKQ